MKRKTARSLSRRRRRLYQKEALLLLLVACAIVMLVVLAVCLGPELEHDTETTTGDTSPPSVVRLPILAIVVVMVQRQSSNGRQHSSRRRRRHLERLLSSLARTLDQAEESSCQCRVVVYVGYDWQDDMENLRGEMEDALFELDVKWVALTANDNDDDDNDNDKYSHDNNNDDNDVDDDLNNKVYISTPMNQLAQAALDDDDRAEYFVFMPEDTEFQSLSWLSLPLGCWTKAAMDVLASFHPPNVGVVAATVGVSVNSNEKEEELARAPQVFMVHATHLQIFGNLLTNFGTSSLFAVVTEWLFRTYGKARSAVVPEWRVAQQQPDEEDDDVHDGDDDVDNDGDDAVDNDGDNDVRDGDNDVHDGVVEDESGSWSLKDSLAVPLDLDPWVRGGRDWIMRFLCGKERPTHTSIQQHDFRSQTNEDFALLENVFGAPPHCGNNHLILEMGAFDGITFSNSYVFEVLLGWKTLHIEANPNNFEALLENRPHSINVHAAMCPPGKTMTIRGAAAVAALENVMSEEYQERWKEYLHDVAQVPCRTFSSVFDEFHVTYIDLFVLDVQGAEYLTLQVMDWSVPVGVWVVELEEHTPEEANRSQKVRDLLEKHGYVEANWNIRDWCLKPHSCAPNVVFVPQDSPMAAKKTGVT